MRMGRGLIQKEYRDALGDADTLGIYTGHSVLQTLSNTSSWTESFYSHDSFVSSTFGVSSCK